MHVDPPSFLVLHAPIRGDTSAPDIRKHAGVGLVGAKCILDEFAEAGAVSRNVRVFGTRRCVC
jgi:hypothetical protein